MRPFKFIVFILGATFFFGFKPWTNEVYIKGHIRKNPKDASGYIEYIIVFVKGDNKVLAKAVTDDKGDFNLTFTPNKEKSFDFYCNSVGIDTMLIASVTTFESDTPEMTFYIPLKYKTNSLGKVICPKCKRTDKIYKIRYGDNPTYVRRINTSGDTTYSPLYKGTYQEDCTERPAKYYCDRDKIKF
jgi:phage FluMu protein Com